MNEADETWMPAQIELASRIYPSDIARALALIAAASPELAKMVEAEIEVPTV